MNRLNDIDYVSKIADKASFSTSFFLIAVVVTISFSDGLIKSEFVVILGFGIGLLFAKIGKMLDDYIDNSKKKI